jgi:type IV pilus assembly protein PilN
MNGINLLPWRELLREQNKRLFFIILNSISFLALIILLNCHIIIHFKKNHQQNLNQHLQEKILHYSTKIQTMEKLKQQQAYLVEQIQFIQQLHSRHALIIKIFENVAQLTPKNIYLKSIKYENNLLIIAGKATCNSEIYQFSENMTKQKIFIQPEITEIKTNDDHEDDYDKEFILHVGAPFVDALSEQASHKGRPYKDYS